MSFFIGVFAGFWLGFAVAAILAVNDGETD